MCKGDLLRFANACDCATILNQERAELLVENGYTIVGRYLTGTVKTTSGTRVSKALTHTEIQAITNAGLKIFAIYQDGGAAPTYFNYEQGFSDASKAVAAAIALNIPYGEIIYFAVDYDFNEVGCEENIIPHFQGIAKYMNETIADYKIGIYGSRIYVPQYVKRDLLIAVLLQICQLAIAEISDLPCPKIGHLISFTNILLQGQTCPFL